MKLNEMNLLNGDEPIEESADSGETIGNSSEPCEDREIVNLDTSIEIDDLVKQGEVLLYEEFLKKLEELGYGKSDLDGYEFSLREFAKECREQAERIQRLWEFINDKIDVKIAINGKPYIHDDCVPAIKTERERLGFSSDEGTRMVDSVFQRRVEEFKEKDRKKIDQLYSEIADDFPSPMSKEAFCGIVGDIINVIEPVSEASREALLVQFLIAFGNLLGNGPYLRQAGWQSVNEFAVIEGDTSRGR